ncbi:MAG: tetratricopeptide repeat protein [bacterium]
MKPLPSKSKIKCFTVVFSLVLIWAGVMGCQPKELTSAKIYLKNNEWPNALEQLQAAVENYPDNPEAHFLLGITYGHYQRFADMVKQFQLSLAISDKFLHEIIAERERYWIEKYNAGIIALERKDYDQAEALLTDAMVIDSTKHEAHKKLALIFLQTNQTDKALTVYKLLLQKSPKDLNLLISMGNLYYSQNKYPEAIIILEKVLTLEPDHRDALANLALSYDALGESEKSEKVYQRAVAANPLDRDLIFIYGVHLFKKNQFSRAIELFERVLELNSDDFSAISNIGNAYLGLAENLRKKLKQPAVQSKSPAEIRNIKDQAILNYSRAIPYLEKVLELRPDSPNLWRNLGVAYINIGEKEKGEEALIKSEQLLIHSSN